jgi:hypothetical protein
MLGMFGDCTYANFVSFAGERYTPFTYKMKQNWQKYNLQTFLKI